MNTFVCLFVCLFTDNDRFVFCSVGPGPGGIRNKYSQQGNVGTQQELGLVSIGPPPSAAGQRLKHGGQLLWSHAYP